MKLQLSRIVLVFLLVAAPLWAKIKTSDVDYFGKVRGYLAEPDDKKKHPGILLVHEWWGLNSQIKTMAEKFAGHGYVALAVDLYEGKVTDKHEEAGKLAAQVRSNMPRAFENLKAALTYLRKNPYVDPARTAAIGWCFGGSWALELAKNDLGVKASVIYYGHFDPKADFEKMRAAIQGHFGGKDKAIHLDGVKEFEATLKTHGKAYEIFIYPNSGHAFANPESANYNKADAETAWNRTLEFLKRRL